MGQGQSNPFLIMGNVGTNIATGVVLVILLSSSIAMICVGSQGNVNDHGSWALLYFGILFLLLIIALMIKSISIVGIIIFLFTILFLIISGNSKITNNASTQSTILSGNLSISFGSIFLIIIVIIMISKGFLNFIRIPGT